MTDTNHGFQALSKANEITEIRVGERTLWLPKAMPKAGNRDKQTAPVVRLLPAFDTYLLGYKDRTLLVASKHQREVYHGGQTVPVVLVDGAAAGTWRYRRQEKRLKVNVHPFDAFELSTEQLIAEEADDIGRFWDVPVNVRYSQEPLRSRSISAALKL